ncbi:YoaK family protein [Sphingobium sp. CR28]|uniref:YoaK family protein n=1 Tax=Sphingobium sp. CR28 TaxID=3400272 RepID=UPI003FF007C5
MRQLHRPLRLLAIFLAGLAGFVDAIGFMTAGGFFVSFMSGNSTRFAVGISDRLPDALIAGGLICAFVIGVAGGAMLTMSAGRHGRTLLLSVVAGVLAFAALSAPHDRAIAVALLAIAMGAENAAFTRDGTVRIGLTYMTGALTRAGHAIAAALLRRPGGDWLPDILLWAGLVAGAIAGAASYRMLGNTALWIAALVALLAAAASWRIGPDER